MKLFIPDTKQQYSISDKGIIYSNYRYLNNGMKAVREKVVAKYKSTQTHTSSLAALSLNRGKKVKTICVNTYLVLLFGIKKPDEHHYYDIINIDGDIFNNEINNIGYKIRMEKGSNYNFYPQPFYNESGEITHKICAVCGERKEIKHFALQSPKKRGLQRTYRNMCEPCRSKKQLQYIKADPLRLAKYDEHRKKFEQSEKGKEWRSEYAKNSHQFHYNTISKHYVCCSLKFYESGLQERDLPDKLYELEKKKLLLFRKRRESKQQLKT